MNTTAARRLPAATLAALLTLAMLLGVDTLASADGAAPQLAKAAATAHS